MSLTGFNKRRRELAEEKAKEKVINEKAFEVKTIPSIDEMTKNDIMKDLDSMNVEYNNRNTKAKLYALLCEVV